MESRLKKAIKLLKITQIEFSKMTGFPLQQIRHMCAGNKTITTEIATKIQLSSGISASWLLLGTGDVFGSDSGSLSKSFEDTTGSREQIQYYPQIKAQAGYGYVNDENSELEVISLPKSILDVKVPRSSKIDAIKVHGDSMHPTIKENDIIFIVKNIEDITDNKIYIIRYGEEIRVKRIFKRMNQKILLRSDNNIYPDEEVDLSSDDVQILGQVVYNIANLS